MFLWALPMHSSAITHHISALPWRFNTWVPYSPALPILLGNWAELTSE